jgi:hypothetical protein
MLVWLMATAFATIPDTVDLEDIDSWDAQASQITAGPSGCWEVVGHASWNWNLGRFGNHQGEAAFAAQFAEGSWEDFHVYPMGELSTERRGNNVRRMYSDDRRFMPMVGRSRSQTVKVEHDSIRTYENADTESRNALRSLLDSVTGDVEYAYTEWDPEREGLVLTRQMPLEKGRKSEEAALEFFFPDGEALPESLQVTFPSRFTLGRFPKLSVTRADAQIVGQPHGNEVFPRAETFNFEASILGFKFSAAQTIAYRSFKRCAVPATSSEE